MQQLAPQILYELNQVDKHMQNVRDLIRPHTSMNKTKQALFSEPFDVYKECLTYQRQKLCQLLERDRLRWEEQASKTALAQELRD